MKYTVLLPSCILNSQGPPSFWRTLQVNASAQQTCKEHPPLLKIYEDKRNQSPSYKVGYRPVEEKNIHSKSYGINKMDYLKDTRIRGVKKIYLFCIPTTVFPLFSSPNPSSHFPSALIHSYSEKSRPPMDINKTWYIKLQQD